MKQALIALISGLSAAAFTLCFNLKHSTLTKKDIETAKAASEKNVDKIYDVLLRCDIDTIKIEDTTNDQLPDLIFLKKDGSKLIYDISNNKLFEEKVENIPEKLK